LDKGNVNLYFSRMPAQPLTQVLILLLASVVVVAIARRQGLPPILGYLVVGMLLGPLAFGLLPNGAATQTLANIGVVFLLFTLGLDFLWARMLAMRREVFGLGAAQLLAVGLAVTLLLRIRSVDWVSAAVLGGAVAMSSTAIVLQQLTDQAELNRTHGRLAFAVLLFQDLAFVPLLALATALAAGGGAFTATGIARLVMEGLLALIAVLAIGRWLLRPLFYEIAHSRLRELLTLTVLLVVSGDVGSLSGVGGPVRVDGGVLCPAGAPGFDLRGAAPAVSGVVPGRVVRGSVHRRRAPVGAADDRGGGDGVAADRGLQ